MADIENVTRRRPVSVLEAVSRGAIRASSLKAQQDLKKMRPESGWGLGLCKVVNLDYEEMLVTLQTVLGASDRFERVPVPLTFPGAGARHFFGAMPEVGDLCIVGWMPQEGGSAEGSRSPVILSWTVPGVWPGREWLTTAEFEVDEHDPTPADRLLAKGTFDRIRHKLRHAQPGNVVASSSQGSDLVLDEGVRLANRRGNEFRLRDQDQAAVLRALQNFQALAGARVYAGMVQRDAQLLHPTMVGDDKLWDGGQQALAGEPLDDLSLPVDYQAPSGFLTPARILRKAPKGTESAEEGYLGRSFLDDPYIDPYRFLQQGGFIDETGYVVDGRWRPDAVCGGKPIFRVAAESRANAHIDAGQETQTEYRIELTHTSDGRLPVSEQTDMFDAERLPDSTPDKPQEGLPTNVPFIEWVMGSVVGNDPFSQQGRPAYGIPLQPIVFEGASPAPRLEAVKLPAEGSSATGTPLEEHAATLFRLLPPSGRGAESFVSFNKKGQLKAAIGGPPGESSVEAFLHGGLKLGLGGELNFLMDGHTVVETLSKASLNLRSREGPVLIYGGGPPQGAESKVAASTGETGTLPAVDIVARTNARVRANETVFLQGNAIDGGATSIQMTAQQEMELNAVKKMALTTDSFLKTVGGKAQESYSGPKMLLPTSGPLHERTYSPAYPGIVAEKVLYTLGDREERFNLGSHSTTILVGNMSFDVWLGTWSARGTTSTLEMGPGGISGAAAVGTVTLKATTGLASMEGLAGVRMSSTAGLATVRGGAGVYLGGPIFGSDMGAILVSGSLEPLTGLPFATWGIGAKAFNIGP